MDATRSRSDRLRHASLVLVALVVAGCGGPAGTPTGSQAPMAPEIPPTKAGTLAALIGPWQPVPLQLDPVFRARARDACARDMEGQPGGIATIDARGEGVAIVRVQNRELIHCEALQITASGDVTGAGGGSRGPGNGGVGAHGLNFGGIQVSRIQGGGLTVQGSSVQGEVGEGIVLVIVRPANGRPFVATVGNGWFAGWWPTQLPDNAEPPIVHFIVEGYDAQRVLRATFTQ